MPTKKLQLPARFVAALLILCFSLPISPVFALREIQEETAAQRETIIRALTTGLEERSKPSKKPSEDVQRFVTEILEQDWNSLGVQGQLTVSYPRQNGYRYPWREGDSQLVEWDVGFVSKSEEAQTLMVRFTVNPVWVKRLSAQRQRGQFELSRALVRARMSHPMALMVKPPAPPQPIVPERMWDFPTQFLTLKTLGAEVVDRLIWQKEAISPMSEKEWRKKLEEIKQSLRPFLQSSQTSWDRFVNESYKWVRRLTHTEQQPDGIAQYLLLVFERSDVDEIDPGSDPVLRFQKPEAVQELRRVIETGSTSTGVPLQDRDRAMARGLLSRFMLQEPSAAAALIGYMTGGSDGLAVHTRAVVSNRIQELFELAEEYGDARERLRLSEEALEEWLKAFGDEKMHYNILLQVAQLVAAQPAGNQRPEQNGQGRLGALLDDDSLPDPARLAIKKVLSSSSTGETAAGLEEIRRYLDEHPKDGGALLRSALYEMDLEGGLDDFLNSLAPKIRARGGRFEGRARKKVDHYVNILRQLPQREMLSQIAASLSGNESPLSEKSLGAYLHGIFPILKEETDIVRRVRVIMDRREKIPKPRGWGKDVRGRAVSFLQDLFRKRPQIRNQVWQTFSAVRWPIRRLLGQPLEPRRIPVDETLNHVVSYLKSPRPASRDKFDEELPILLFHPAVFSLYRQELKRRSRGKGQALAPAERDLLELLSDPVLKRRLSDLGRLKKSAGFHGQEESLGREERMRSQEVSEGISALRGRVEKIGQDRRIKNSQEALRVLHQTLSASAPKNPPRANEAALFLYDWRDHLHLPHLPSISRPLAEGAMSSLARYLLAKTLKETLLSAHKGGSFGSMNSFSKSTLREVLLDMETALASLNQGQEGKGALYAQETKPLLEETLKTLSSSSTGGTAAGLEEPVSQELTDAQKAQLRFLVSHLPKEILSELKEWLDPPLNTYLESFIGQKPLRPRDRSELEQALRELLPIQDGLSILKDWIGTLEDQRQEELLRWSLGLFPDREEEPFAPTVVANYLKRTYTNVPRRFSGKDAAGQLEDLGDSFRQMWSGRIEAERRDREGQEARQRLQQQPDERREQLNAPGARPRGAIGEGPRKPEPEKPKPRPAVPVAVPVSSAAPADAPSPVRQIAKRQPTPLDIKLKEARSEIDKGRKTQEAQRRTKLNEVQRIKGLDGVPLSPQEREALYRYTVSAVEAKQTFQTAEFDHLAEGLQQAETLEAADRFLSEAREARLLISGVSLDPFFQKIREERARDRKEPHPAAPALQEEFPSIPEEKQDLSPEEIPPAQEEILPAPIQEEIHAGWERIFSTEPSLDDVREIRLGRLYRRGSSGEIEWHPGGTVEEGDSLTQFDLGILLADYHEGDEVALVIASPASGYPSVWIATAALRLKEELSKRLGVEFPLSLVTYNGERFQAMSLASGTPSRVMEEAEDAAGRAMGSFGQKRGVLALQMQSAISKQARASRLPYETIFSEQTVALFQVLQEVLQHVFPERRVEDRLDSKAWKVLMRRVQRAFSQGRPKDREKDLLRFNRFVGLARTMGFLFIEEVIAQEFLFGGSGKTALLVPSPFGKIPAVQPPPQSSPREGEVLTVSADGDSGRVQGEAYWEDGRLHLHFPNQPIHDVREANLAGRLWSGQCVLVKEKEGWRLSQDARFLSRPSLYVIGFWERYVRTNIWVPDLLGERYQVMLKPWEAEARLLRENPLFQGMQQAEEEIGPSPQQITKALEAIRAVLEDPALQRDLSGFPAEDLQHHQEGWRQIELNRLEVADLSAEIIPLFEGGSAPWDQVKTTCQRFQEEWARVNPEIARRIGEVIDHAQRTAAAQGGRVSDEQAADLMMDFIVVVANKAQWLYHQRVIGPELARQIDHQALRLVLGQLSEETLRMAQGVSADETEQLRRLRRRTVGLIEMVRNWRLRPVLEEQQEDRKPLSMSEKVSNLPVLGLGVLRVLPDRTGTIEFGRLLEAEGRFGPSLRPEEFDEPFRNDVEFGLLANSLSGFPTIHTVSHWCEICEQIQGAWRRKPILLGAYDGQKIRLWRWRLDPQDSEGWLAAGDQLELWEKSFEQALGQVNQFIQREQDSWRQRSFKAGQIPGEVQGFQQRLTGVAVLAFRTAPWPSRDRVKDLELLKEDVRQSLLEIYKRYFGTDRKEDLAQRHRAAVNDSITEVSMRMVEWLGRQALEASGWFEPIDVDWQATDPEPVPKPAADPLARKREELLGRARNGSGELHRDIAELNAVAREELPDLVDQFLEGLPERKRPFAKFGPFLNWLKQLNGRRQQEKESRRRDLFKGLEAVKDWEEFLALQAKQAERFEEFKEDPELISLRAEIRRLLHPPPERGEIEAALQEWESALRARVQKIVELGLSSEDLHDILDAVLPSREMEELTKSEERERQGVDQRLRARRAPSARIREGKKRGRGKEMKRSSGRVPEPVSLEQATQLEAQSALRRLRWDRLQSYLYEQGIPAPVREEFIRLLSEDGTEWSRQEWQALDGAVRRFIQAHPWYPPETLVENLNIAVGERGISSSALVGQVEAATRMQLGPQTRFSLQEIVIDGEDHLSSLLSQAAGLEEAAKDGADPLWGLPEDKQRDLVELYRNTPQRRNYFKAWLALERSLKASGQSRLPYNGELFDALRRFVWPEGADNTHPTVFRSRRHKALKGVHRKGLEPWLETLPHRRVHVDLETPPPGGKPLDVNALQEAIRQADEDLKGLEKKWGPPSDGRISSQPGAPHRPLSWRVHLDQLPPEVRRKWLARLQNLLDRKSRPRNRRGYQALLYILTTDETRRRPLGSTELGYLLGGLSRERARQIYAALYRLFDGLDISDPVLNFRSPSGKKPAEKIALDKLEAVERALQARLRDPAFAPQAIVRPGESEVVESLAELKLGDRVLAPKKVVGTVERAEGEGHGRTVTIHFVGARGGWRDKTYIESAYAAMIKDPRFLPNALRWGQDSLAVPSGPIASKAPEAPVSSDGGAKTDAPAGDVSVGPTDDEEPAAVGPAPDEGRGILRKLVNGHVAIINDFASRDRYRLFTAAEQEAMRHKAREEARGDQSKQPARVVQLSGRRFKRAFNRSVRRRDSLTQPAEPDQAEIKMRTDEKVDAGAYRRAAELERLDPADFSAVWDKMSKLLWTPEILEEFKDSVLQAVGEAFDRRPVSVKEVFDVLRKGLERDSPSGLLEFVRIGLSEQAEPSFHEKTAGRGAGLEEKRVILVTPEVAAMARYIPERQVYRVFLWQGQPPPVGVRETAVIRLGKRPQDRSEEEKLLQWALEQAAGILRRERGMDILLVRWVGNLAPDFLTSDDAQIVVDSSNVAEALSLLNRHTGRYTENLGTEAQEVRDLSSML